MAGNIDLILAEIENIGTFIAKLMGFKLLNKAQLREEINNGYAKWFDLNEEDINLNNPKIIAFLESEDKCKLFLNKLEVLTHLIELDYEHDTMQTEKKKVIYQLLKKINSIDCKNYSIERVAKLKTYEY
jgi:hypothetical protein